MIRKFAFDFYMSIPIWMSNIEEVVKGIVGSRCRLIIKTNTATMEGSRAAAYDDSLRAQGTLRVDAQVEEESGAANLCYEMRHGGDTCDLGRARTSSARSRQATRENRNTEVEGPGTGPRSTVVVPCSGATSGGDPATPEQSVDDEAVYLNVAGECSKGRVYGLGSVGRKKRRYGTPGASTSRDADVVPRASLARQQEPPPPPPPTPPPHDQEATAANRSGDPPQQGDNVGRETTPSPEEWKMWRRLQSTQGDCEGKTSGSIEGVGESSKKSHRQVELLSPIPKPPSLKKRRKREEEKPKLKRRKKR
ncbi:hypothetical protein Sjap_017022 [Stephania japonica]|uniref:Uncharacterized protein n=1 Tax=Stephania japonica TaxID=461633 RepID=A0AAP0I5D2_9MAGN